MDIEKRGQNQKPSIVEMCVTGYGVMDNSIYRTTDKEKDDLHRLYPKENPGEGWFGRETAERIIKDFFSKKKNSLWEERP